MSRSSSLFTLRWRWLVLSLVILAPLLILAGVASSDGATAQGPSTPTPFQTAGAGTAVITQVPVSTGYVRVTPPTGFWDATATP